MNKSPNVLLPLLISVFLMGGAYAHGQSGIFDRVGIISGHGTHGSFAEENIDLFTGNLTLRYRDVFLPGPNGFNLEVWRVYNSKILKDRQSGDPVVQAYHHSWVGIGWTMHMGMVHAYDSDTPVIEFPDGRLEVAYPGYLLDYNGKHITRDFLWYDKTERKLYFQNGVIWYFGASRTITRADGTSDPVRLVTRIENALGHHIDIEYDPLLSPAIDHITDSMGRVIWFISTLDLPRKLTQIKVKDENGNDRIFNYSVTEFPNGYTRLDSITTPELPPTTFEYNSGASSDYELKKLTTSYGGVVEYSYNNHNFYFHGIQLDSRVLAQKTINFGVGDPATWNYAYPDYNGVATGTAHIQGPLYGTDVTYHGYDADCPGKIGWIRSLERESGQYSETFDWEAYPYTSAHWFVLGTDMGEASGVLPSSTIKNSPGNTALKTEYLYERHPVKKYGLPTKTLYYVNEASVPKYYTNHYYYFETVFSFLGKYLLDLPWKETKHAGVDNALLADTHYSYFQEEGKWGICSQVHALKVGSTYCDWDFAYDSADPQGKAIQIWTETPTGTKSREFYHFGIKAEQATGETTHLWQIISEHNSAVTSGRYGTLDGPWINYSYDGLGRLRIVDMPDGRNDLVTDWSNVGEKKAVTTQGSNTITKYWDGMGRDLGYIEEGDGTTLFFRKTLDAEGRIKTENRGSTNVDHKFSYSYNSGGDITQVTDPMGKTTHTTYLEATKTVTDPEGHSTTFEYNDLPGIPTKVTDAQGHIANYSYDALGRLADVNYNGARSHSYRYDLAGNLIYEEHPETGPITYTYYDDNQVKEKIWGGTVIFYDYWTDHNGKLKRVRSGDGTTVEEEILYLYTDWNNGLQLSNVGSSKGWKRYPILYDVYGNVTSETIEIPGLSPKTTTYEYDANNNLSKITYPDGNCAGIASNGLNRPESLTFNSSVLISAASYGPGKAISGLTFAGNGTQYAATYYASGALNSASLTRGGSTLYHAGYEYDGAGNVTTISSTAPAPTLNASFGYDSLNRLISAAYSSGRVANFTYEYDAYGNMTTVKENGLDVFSKTYTVRNRINDPNYSYDARGNVTTDGINNYYWDKKNQLSSILSSTAGLLGPYFYDERGQKIGTYPLVPEIDISCEGTDVPSGGKVTFDSPVNQHVDKTFTIENLGYGNLVMDGPPIVTISGVNAGQFSVVEQPSSPVLPQGNTTFKLRFSPTSAGPKTAAISISSNDGDESPYIINLEGNFKPEINIVGVQDGGIYNFGSVGLFTYVQKDFLTQNLGIGDLLLSGTPRVRIDGDDYGQFTVEVQPDGLVPPAGTTNFIVQFSPVVPGRTSAQLSIVNNDEDENPYNFTLKGYGSGSLFGKSTNTDETAINITSPIGDEEFLPGSTQVITWTGGKASKFVRIEYSTDNGSSYKTIVERTPNAGSYDWQVPPELSPVCLIRISDPDGLAAVPRILAFEFNLKMSRLQAPSNADSELAIHISLPNKEAQTALVAELTISPNGETAGDKVIFNDDEAKCEDLGLFSAEWHHVRIALNLDGRSGTLELDERVLLDNVPLQMTPMDSTLPEFTVRRGSLATTDAWIDDFEIRFLDQTQAPAEDIEYIVKPMLSDMFDRYSTGVAPSPGGWQLLQDSDLKMAEEVSGQEISAVVDEATYITPAKSFWLRRRGDGSFSAVKAFALPGQIPYDISAAGFAIVAEPTDGQGTGFEEGSTGRRDEIATNLAADMEQTAAPSARSVVRMLNTSSAGSFYIYSFDGRLLAEYDVSGACLRDYIYMGGQLVAEYVPATGQYFYYVQDQVRSTRVVTDGAGTVVYAEAHDPYGGIQKTWVNEFDPKRKFSDKERDPETGLDYFGARYYSGPVKWPDGHTSGTYRWLSVDPVLDTDMAILNPQAWNLYSFCGNSPVTFFDLEGKNVRSLIWFAYLSGLEWLCQINSLLSRGERVGQEPEIRYDLDICDTLTGDQVYEESLKLDPLRVGNRHGFVKPRYKIKSRVVKRGDFWGVHVTINVKLICRVAADSAIFKNVSKHEFSHLLADSTYFALIGKVATDLEEMTFSSKFKAEVSALAFRLFNFQLQLGNLYSYLAIETKQFIFGK